MIIKSHTKEYVIKFVHELNFLIPLFSDENCYFVIDSNVFDLYRESVFSGIPRDRMYIFDATEENKNIDSVLDICSKMTVINAKRNMHLVSAGGGITQDVTGVVANLLYRGIRWTFVPTTLLASCDSCIGGKTSLNYEKYKNLLGTFFPPDEILICPEMLKTLSLSDYYSGLGEVIKFNIMRGEQGIQNIHDEYNQLLERDLVCVEKYIHSSLEYKRRFIEEDEFDRGVRIKLNYAHTFGHAIESVSDYAVPHGTAVAMGTIVANYISNMRNILSDDFRNKIEELLTPIILKKYSSLNLCIDKVIGAVKKDKKQTGNCIRAILLNDEFELIIYDDITKEEIEQGYAYLHEILKN